MSKLEMDIIFAILESIIKDEEKVAQEDGKINSQASEDKK
ncbi:hypothetical protein FACS189450_15380 [Spirochaetia bacterium]|nr:hypothetical protein FACS189450_15380 [Spirochaetia bacterium]GHU92960.1 hypothetical protein FACS189479_03300 [Spirochaetia bacterium]